MEIHRKPKAAFTLLELLVVIVIVAVLFTLGVNVAYGAMARAHSTKCLSNLRQVGVAIQLYTGDNGGRLPDTGHVRAEDGTSLSWTNTLSAYLSTNFIGRCPANKDSVMPVTYGWNDQLTATDGTGISVMRCRAPASTLAVAETADTYTSEHFHFGATRSRMTFNQFKSSVGVDRHEKTANYLFVDGHAESLSTTDIRTRLNSTDTIFLQP